MTIMRALALFAALALAGLMGCAECSRSTDCDELESPVCYKGSCVDSNSRELDCTSSDDCGEDKPCRSTTTATVAIGEVPEITEGEEGTCNNPITICIARDVSLCD